MRLMAKLAVLTAWLLLGLASAGQGAEPPQRILFLSSYHLGLPIPDGIRQAMLAAVKAGGFSAGDLFFEELDLVRDPSPEHRADLIRMLHHKLDNTAIGIIVAEGTPALDFVANEGRDLFPDAALLTLLVPPADPVAKVGHRQILTMPWRVDPAGTLRAALGLFPKTKRVLVVTGANDSILPFLDSAKTAFAPWADRLTFEYTDRISFEAMLRRVATLPADSVILYSSYFVDTTGRAFVPAEVALQVNQAASAPVFGNLDAFLGQGILGGSLLKTDQIGRQAGRIAVDYLQGRIARSERVTSFDTPAVMMFDWRELERWNAASAQLPADAIVVGRPVTLWSQYRGAVIATAAAFLVMALLIVALLILNRRLDRAKAAAGESEARFRVMIERAPEAIIVYDAECKSIADANAKAEALFGTCRDNLLNATLEGFYSTSQPDGRDPSASINDHALRALAGEEVMFERQVRSHDGGPNRTCEVRVVPLPHRNRKLVRASFIDISERKRAEAALQEKNEALARSNAELASYAYVASHDLREPLRNLTAFSTMLARRLEGRLKDDEADLFKIIADAATRMDALIRDLLEMSCVGQRDHSPRPVPLADTVAQALERLRAPIEAAGATIEVAPDLPEVRGNGEELALVFLNIIDNALTYRGEAPPRIRIGCRPESAQSWRIEIADNGIGIESGHDYEERIFGLFQRLHQRDDYGGGTGIGLPICRKIIARHGGKLWAESAGLGLGTTFIFTLAGTTGR